MTIHWPPILCSTFHLIDLQCSSNKKLSCRREAAQCFMFVCSQLQHTYSAVFLLPITAALDLLVPDRQTDERTDGRTDGGTPHAGIYRAYA